ncbi:hypothetical protein TorRG33x02_236310 [Trema orientale]|uniref:Uncharacterized protein n=1 Tax=Trema orientale TaxID=63057 RepID=A0A2P5E1B9_TREOI|nr:hypothetical protein TorRG33x02_236310 [Trema orientale]
MACTPFTSGNPSSSSSFSGPTFRDVSGIKRFGEQGRINRHPNGVLLPLKPITAVESVIDMGGVIVQAGVVTNGNSPFVVSRKFSSEKDSLIGPAAIGPISSRPTGDFSVQISDSNPLVQGTSGSFSFGATIVKNVSSTGEKEH